MTSCRATWKPPNPAIASTPPVSSSASATLRPSPSSPATHPRPVRPRRRTPAHPELVEGPADSQAGSGSFRQHLADLICEETDNGRTAVRFLVDVMQGNLPDFKPHHRLSAARELLHRGFDDPAPDQDPEDEADYDYDREHDAWRRLHDPDGSYTRRMDGKWHREGGMSPPHSRCRPSSPCRTETSAAPTSYPASDNIRDDEYSPVNIETYEEEDCEEEEGTCEEEDCQRDCTPAQIATLQNSEELPEELTEDPPEDSSEDPARERPPPPGPATGPARIRLDSIAVDSLTFPIWEALAHPTWAARLPEVARLDLAPN